MQLHIQYSCFYDLLGMIIRALEVAQSGMRLLTSVNGSLANRTVSFGVSSIQGHAGAASVTLAYFRCLYYSTRVILCD